MTPQNKPTADEVAKEAVESWRNGEVKLLTENPSEVGRYFSDFVLDGDKRLVEIFKQALLRFSSQQAAPLVEALETLKWLIDMQADLKHRASQQDTNAYDKAVAALATYHANQQEGRG